MGNINGEWLWFSMLDCFIVINVCSVRLRRSALVLTLDRLEFQLRTFGRLPPHFSAQGYGVLTFLLLGSFWFSISCGICMNLFWYLIVRSQVSKLKFLLEFQLTLSGPGGANFSPPLVLITCCTLKNAAMNSKLLDNFSYDPIEALVK